MMKWAVIKNEFDPGDRLQMSDREFIGKTPDELGKTLPHRCRISCDVDEGETPEYIIFLCDDHTSQDVFDICDGYEDVYGTIHTEYYNPKTEEWEPV